MSVIPPDEMENPCKEVDLEIEDWFKRFKDHGKFNGFQDLYMQEPFSFEKEPASTCTTARPYEEKLDYEVIERSIDHMNREMEKMRMDVRGKITLEPIDFKIREIEEKLLKLEKQEEEKDPDPIYFDPKDLDT